MVEKNYILEKYQRKPDPHEYAKIRDLYKKHSIAEDNRDLPGLISTLTTDCVYELIQEKVRWEGHSGAQEFYTSLLSAFPDIHFELTDIVIGPQGVCEEADVTGTHLGEWLGENPTGKPINFSVIIWFPWSAEEKLFQGEKIYIFEETKAG
ncbi:MAG: ester cyclase [Candidatus Marinimicrobia bacterium]|nr:ester cyclase [Candidatus Neomarinimicrobiota bacterium]